MFQDALDAVQRFHDERLKRQKGVESPGPGSHGSPTL